MRARRLAHALLALCCACAGRNAGEAATPAAAAAPAPDAATSLAASADYRTPAPPIVALLTASPPPQPLLHARSGHVALLFREGVMQLERLARPRLGLAGFRYDPKSRTSGVEPLVERVEVVDVAAPGSAPREWRPASGALLDDVRFSPDGRTLSALLVAADGPARLALFDVASGSERVLDTPINPAWGDPCSWVGADALLCRVLPADPGPLPREHLAPIEVEHDGGRAPTRTWPNLLDNAYEDALFEHHFGVDVARVGTDGSFARVPAMRGLYADLEPSPDGAFAVAKRLERPFSRLVPASRFPSVIEVWDLKSGERRYASPVAGFGIESGEGGESDEPRRFAWKPGTPTTLGWIEPMSVQGDVAVERWLAVTVPETSKPFELARSEVPIRLFGWTAAGTPFYGTSGDGGARVKIFAIRDGKPQLIWDRTSAESYGNAGHALRVDGNDGPVLEQDGRIFLAGDGNDGHGGPQPFLDAFELKSRKSQRLFESEPGVFEQVIGVLDPQGPVLVTSRETETQPPNLFLLRGAERTALRPYASPYPQLAGVTRRVLEYRRKDGIALSATLYLPAGRREGERLPTLVWIYPYEFADREHAEMLDVRSVQFHKVKGPSPLAALLAGYAVLLNPTVPILYEQGAVNDDYLGQLVASTDAAVDYLVKQGIADPARIAVGGRSYGAFSTANLMIHSQRFATGIAMSGAYNRTLTPFGFQHEKRSFWQASELYARISPFYFADRVRGPLLLVHGGADENAGTPPLQTRRFFHALAGEGKPVRYVELPYEGHHYWARESVLHAAAEMIDWLDAKIGPRSHP
jgi:dipeptidyl aminopeptidase/acylaminoacyl peptidase